MIVVLGVCPIQGVGVVVGVDLPVEVGKDLLKVLLKVPVGVDLLVRVGKVLLKFPLGVDLQVGVAPQKVLGVALELAVGVVLEISVGVALQLHLQDAQQQSRNSSRKDAEWLASEKTNMDALTVMSTAQVYTIFNIK